MKYKLAAIFGAVAVAACGGGGGDPIQVASGDTPVTTNATVAGALANTPFSFDSGVAALGTSAATTVQFTSATATPGFNIASGGNSATGSTSFGSCIFAVTSSTFPAGHSLAAGQTVTVNPCSLSVKTTGAVANGQATSRSVALLLGAAASAGATVTVAVTAGGQLTLNGASAGTVQLVPVSG